MTDPDAGQRLTAAEEAVIAAQLGRPPRSIHAIGHRCPCGNPDVVATEARQHDGFKVVLRQAQRAGKIAFLFCR